MGRRKPRSPRQCQHLPCRRRATVRVGWGWTGVMPGLGLLAEDFTEPSIRHFDLRNGEYAQLREDVRIPLQPFCGTMGVATDEPGPHDVLPPTRGAGNIDTRHLGVGT